MYIEHIAMYVNDLEKTKEFFIKYLGAKSNNIYNISFIKKKLFFKNITFVFVAFFFFFDIMYLNM